MLSVKDIIYDVIISVLIMSLLSLTVIPLFRNSMDIIAVSAGKVTETSKISRSELKPEPLGEVNGCDVVSAIRYYSNVMEMEIVVTDKSGRTESYIGKSYDEENYSIQYDSIFKADYYYEGTRLVKALYTEKIK